MRRPERITDEVPIAGVRVRRLGRRHRRALLQETHPLARAPQVVGIGRVHWADPDTGVPSHPAQFSVSGVAAYATGAPTVSTVTARRAAVAVRIPRTLISATRGTRTPRSFATTAPPSSWWRYR